MLLESTISNLDDKKVEFENSLFEQFKVLNSNDAHIIVLY